MVAAENGFRKRMGPEMKAAMSMNRIFTNAQIKRATSDRICTSISAAATVGIRRDLCNGRGCTVCLQPAF